MRPRSRAAWERRSPSSARRCGGGCSFGCGGFLELLDHLHGQEVQSVRLAELIVDVARDAAFYCETASEIKLEFFGPVLKSRSARSTQTMLGRVVDSKT